MKCGIKSSLNGGDFLFYENIVDDKSEFWMINQFIGNIVLKCVKLIGVLAVNSGYYCI